MRCGWNFSRLLTLHFHASPFILNLTCGAEKKDVSLSQLLKSELICYLKSVKVREITFFFLFLFFTLGGVLHRSQIAD